MMILFYFITIKNMYIYISITGYLLNDRIITFITHTSKMMMMFLFFSSMFLFVSCTKDS